MAESSTNKNEKSTNSDAGYIIAAGVLIALIALAFSSCNGDSSSKKAGPVKDSTALVLCKKEAKKKAPYGFESSTSDTDISHEGGNVVVTFNDATIGTALGANKTQTIRCEVGGSESAPTIEGFGSID